MSRKLDWNKLQQAIKEKKTSWIQDYSKTELIEISKKFKILVNDKDTIDVIRANLRLFIKSVYKKQESTAQKSFSNNSFNISGISEDSVTNPFKRSTNITRSPPNTVQEAPATLDYSRLGAYPKQPIIETSSTESEENPNKNINNISNQEEQIDNQDQQIRNPIISQDQSESSQFSSDESLENIKEEYTEIELNQQSIINGTNRDTINQGSSNNLTERQNLIILSPNRINNHINMSENIQKLPLKEVINLVPDFDGENIPASVYIQKLKQAKLITSAADEQNLTNILKIKLKGDAYLALENAAINNINDLITAIKTLYPSGEDIYQLGGELSQMEQLEDETIIKFTNRIKQIIKQMKELKRAEPNQTEATLLAFDTKLNHDAVKYFKEGLKIQYQDKIANHDTLEAAALQAIGLERKYNSKKYSEKKSINIVNQFMKTNKSESKSILTCQICRDRFHEALFCRAAGCVYCKGTDHLSNDCRNVSKKIQIICKHCSHLGHSISACKFNLLQENHCQYCQEAGHEATQCPFIGDFEMCWKCKESGHNPNLCLNNKLKQELCAYCNSSNHEMQNCPVIICAKCNKQGHTIKTCTVGENIYTNSICTFCEDTGHNVEQCEAKKIMVAEYKAKQQKCQICDIMGHTAKNCYRNRNSNNQNNREHNSYNSRNNFNRFGNNRNMQRFAQNRTCEYCGMQGHSTDECRKMQAMQNMLKSKTQTQCSFCNNVGHSMQNCNKLKNLETSLGNFCSKCKIAGHTTENCYRKQNFSGNDQTLPGESA